MEKKKLKEKNKLYFSIIFTHSIIPVRNNGLHALYGTFVYVWKCKLLNSTLNT